MVVEKETSYVDAQEAARMLVPVGGLEGGRLSETTVWISETRVSSADEAAFRQ